MPGWGCLGAPVRVEVRDPDHTPYCVASADDRLTVVLTTELPHAQMLEAVDQVIARG